MATKIVKNIDEEVWRQFAGRCKSENVFIGQKLSNILSEYVRKRGEQ